ncbi:hypothetical protein [Kushneria phosphatilytica]|uniref:Uncharacterized protein n=1 Tax=Kushneria phosphatilytica TaxID=657387 RepID=A0A1S1NSH7_9GAMM|nr:hypothetical protein [Kushneria phosphatilytica]OHV12214.1 hypothetical protein BH688_06090 [Kushneria phosphatilytica]QEL11408.1 hypothetical protein FY550_09830 [Kushneria phosphatilytica]
MSSEIQLNREIQELRGFIKKLLQDPAILNRSMEIARAHFGESEADARIADELSRATSIKIPQDAKDHTPADRLFLEVLKEVVEEEKALY